MGSISSKTENNMDNLKLANKPAITNTIMDAAKSVAKTASANAAINTAFKRQDKQDKPSINSSNTNPKSSEYTSEYGTVQFISFWSTIYSRLAYFDDHQFLLYYTSIFGPIIPVSIMTQINEQVKKSPNGICNIDNDAEMLGLKEGQDYQYTTSNGTTQDLKVYKDIDGKLHVGFLPFAQEINRAIGEERASDGTDNCQFEFKYAVPNEQLVFASIATSNYGEIYVVGDKRMPNIVNVVFRGTYSSKSASSYTSPLSILPAFIGWASNTPEKYLFGIFKLISDIVHTLSETIIYVGNQINPTAGQGEMNILTTGHSLGGGLSTIFAYLWVAHITLQPEFIKNSAGKFNSNIACISIGSPRVMDKELSALFCCLTSNNKLNHKCASNSTIQHTISNEKITGRILYYRVTSYNDPVPALPNHSTFVHPCSSSEKSSSAETNELNADLRKQVTTDCFVQISNSVSNRCRMKSGANGLANYKSKLAITPNYKLQLACVNTKEGRKKNKLGITESPKLANLMGYHTMYLGIIFINALSLSSFMSSMVTEKEIKRNNKDTVCRLTIYPTYNHDYSKAGVIFFNLANTRGEIVQIDNVDTMLENDATANATANATAPSIAPAKKVSTFNKLKILLSSNKPMPIAEDKLVGNFTFTDMIEHCSDYDILTKPTSTEYQALYQFKIKGREASFVGNDASMNVNAATNSNAPTNTNAPTNRPTNSNAPTNTNAPTNRPTNSNTNAPTNSNTNAPTNIPTNRPTNSNTNAPAKDGLLMEETKTNSEPLKEATIGGNKRKTLKSKRYKAKSKKYRSKSKRITAKMRSR